jgi:hypothetical protein
VTFFLKNIALYKSIVQCKLEISQQVKNSMETSTRQEHLVSRYISPPQNRNVVANCNTQHQRHLLASHYAQWKNDFSFNLMINN